MLKMDISRTSFADSSLCLKMVSGYIKSLLPNAKDFSESCRKVPKQKPWHGLKRAHRNYPWAGSMPVIHINGSPYDMGFQYGKKCRSLIPLVAERYREQILNGPIYSGNASLLKDHVSLYEASVNDIFGTEYIDEMRGIADGAGTSYEDICLLMCRSDLMMPQFEQLLNQTEGCISWSAWGDATAPEKGLMIATHNTEGGRSPGIYQLIIVAKPNKGHRFICSIFAGELAHHCGYLNDAGVFVSMSALRGTKRESMTFVPYTPIVRYLAQYAASAQEGHAMLINMVRKGHFGSGASNVEIVDETEAIYLQVTPAKCSEPKQTSNNFVLATDNPPLEEMLPYLTTKRVPSPKREGWLKLIRANHGFIDVFRAMEMMGSHLDWMTGEDKAGFHSLCIHGEALGLYFGTKGSNIALPTERGMYVAAEPCIANDQHNWRYVSLKRTLTLADLPGLFMKGDNTCILCCPDTEAPGGVLSEQQHDLVLIGDSRTNQAIIPYEDTLHELGLRVSMTSEGSTIRAPGIEVIWGKKHNDILLNGESIGHGPDSQHYDADAAYIAVLEENARMVLILCGFGFKGTIAAGMLISDYRSLVALRDQCAVIFWRDRNRNGFVDFDEIQVLGPPFQQHA